MFKNVMVYRMGGLPGSLAQFEAALGRASFVPCTASQDLAIGWVPPRGQAHGVLAESVAGQWIARLMIETKSVPGAVVRRRADEEAAQIEAAQGRRPGKKELKTLREDARLALLPQAFARESAVWVWIDPQAGLLVTDAGSTAKADAVVTQLIRSIDGLQLALLNTATAPQTAMAQWLAAQSPDELPPALAVERDCELKSADEDKAAVKFTRHNLATDEVRQHIAEGKHPTRLALSWEGRVSFTLTDTLQLKKVKFLEGTDATSSAPAQEEDAFDANVALATGELSALLADLITALGGEATLGQAQ